MEQKDAADQSDANQGDEDDPAGPFPATIFAGQDGWHLAQHREPAASGEPLTGVDRLVAELTQCRPPNSGADTQHDPDQPDSQPVGLERFFRQLRVDRSA